MERVLLGMSGGVDSSVAAYLLQKDGYEVVGITMSLINKENDTSIEDARKVCEKLCIEHHVLDLKNEFKNEIINKFIDSYLNAKTPNPCIDCNKFFKFGYLWNKAKELNCKYIATGHYASIKDNNIYKIDSPKDQTYFLSKINKEVIPHILFPLSNYYNKEETRQIAEDQGLVTHNKKDSQDICFIENDYSDILEQNITNLPPKGNFILKDGTVLGEHKGIIYYTIGQRKGLGISYKCPLYVIEINKDTNEVILGKEDELYTNEVYINNINILVDKLPNKAQGKIRYKARPTNCTIEVIDENNYKIVFEEPVKSATPGQTLALYDNDLLLGGGTIKK